MLNKLDPQAVWANVLTWFKSNMWTSHTAYELVIIAVSCALGGIAYRLTHKHTVEAIDQAEIPFRIKRALRTLSRLMLPVFILATMFLVGQIAASGLFGLKISLTIAVMKVLFTWVVIRIAVQFIDNTIARNFVAFTILAIATLSIFGVLDQTTATLDSIGFSVGKFRLSALEVIKSIIWTVILLYMALFVSTFAERRVLRSKSLTRSSQVLIAKVIRISLVAIAILIGVTSAGLDLSIFAVLGGAIGLGIGFGLQKVVSNLFSGLLLLMDQSIRPGDVIEIQDSGTFGWVNKMAARYTEIVTRDNKSFLIPNEDFITQRVINWSHGDRLIRVEVTFGVHYDSDPHEVIRIAKDACVKPERVVDDHEPVCWLTEFGDSSLNFSLRFWIKDAENGITNVKGEVMLALWDAFKAANINIPYPHREVFVHQA